MDKTNIDALVQTIERFLDSIYKNRFSIEQYLIYQTFCCLKAAIKADISRPEIERRMDNRDEARVRGIPLGEFRTKQLLEALHRNIDTVTAAKSAQW